MRRNRFLAMLMTVTSAQSCATKNLVIDLTPTCLNRTAIYHIALDTAAVLDAITVGFQYCGEIRPRLVDHDDEPALQQAFFNDVAHWGSESPHADELDELQEFDDDGLRRLYFDPIYTLYRPLTARDIVFVLDLSTLTDPDWHNPVVARAYERAFRKLAGSPARIVSISDHCTAALRANLAIPSKDIVTVPLYLRDLKSDAVQTPVASLSARRFLLFVGSLETRKNLSGLMQAFALSGLADDGWVLALAGGDAEGAARIREDAETIQGVQLLGFVSDSELAWLYAEASAFIYPSFLEGFGLPLVEAMASGLPCLASLTGASSEICGDLGILVDPYEISSMTTGILECVETARRLTDAERAKLSKRARSYTFDRYMAALTPVLS